MARPHRFRGPTASQTEVLYDSHTDATLSESAKTYRDAFCREYIKDFCAKEALFRIGYANVKTAGCRGHQLLREPYVANRIDALVRQLQPTDVVQRGQVMAKMWKEANDYGNDGSVRVAATAHVAKMLGMFVNKDEENTSIPIGVMLVPCMTVADWETSAVTAQALLKRQAGGALECPAPQSRATGQN